MLRISYTVRNENMEHADYDKSAEVVVEVTDDTEVENDSLELILDHCNEAAFKMFHELNVGE